MTISNGVAHLFSMTTIAGTTAAKAAPKLLVFSTGALAFASITAVASGFRKRSDGQNSSGSN